MLYGLAQQLYWDFRRLSEGRSRWFIESDKHQQLNQEIESADLQLTAEQRVRAVEAAEEEIRNGKIQESDRSRRIREIEESQLSVTRAHLSLAAPQEIGRAVRVRGQPEVIDVLLNRGITSEQICELCKDAFMRRNVKLGSEIREVDVPAWPSVSSMLPDCLTKFSDHYIGALNDPRFPGCDVSQRPTNRLKQFWFLARALAGAVCGVKTRTAVNLVGSLRPEEMFRELRAGKPPRNKKKRKLSNNPAPPQK